MFSQLDRDILGRPLAGSSPALSRLNRFAFANRRPAAVFPEQPHKVNNEQQPKTSARGEKYFCAKEDLEHTFFDRPLTVRRVGEIFSSPPLGRGWGEEAVFSRARSIFGVFQARCWNFDPSPFEGSRHVPEELVVRANETRVGCRHSGNQYRVN